MSVLVAILATQPPAPPEIGDLGAERELDLSATTTGCVLETASPVIDDAEFPPESAQFRQARKTPPVVKSQIILAPDIPRPAAPPTDRSPPGRSPPQTQPRWLVRVQSRGPISSDPSESSLIG